jgi:hypothetical protein
MFLRLAMAIAVLALGGPVETQTNRAPARRPAQPATKTEPAKLECPSVLGQGVETKLMFCDVVTGTNQAEGIIIKLPPHTGPVTLTFDLHNRHLYSEELIKANRAYRHYTATIGVLTADNTLLSRFVVQNEFRSDSDLIDRIADDATGGLKAVAPTGSESVSIQIPAAEQSVSILGEKLAVLRPEGVGVDNFTAPGRPIAIVSNVMLQYRPGPVRRPATRRR